MSKRIPIIVNPASGVEQPILGPLNDVFKEQDIDWTVHLTGPGTDVTQLARQLASDNPDCIAAYGGDGTVNAVASALVGGDVPLGILPGGTGNSLAKGLAFSADLREAASRLAAPGPDLLPIDIGMLNNARPFVVGAVLGPFVRVMRNTTRELKDQYGVLAYLMTTLEELQQAEEHHYRFTLDGEQVEVTGVTCYINNTGNLGLLWRSDEEVSRKPLTDGLLDVYVLRRLDFVEVARALAAASDLPMLDDFSIPRWQASHITLETHTPREANIDGEFDVTTPLDIRVRAGALKVVV